ncbi:type II secretion system protein, partial [bacterium]|nr:type II secretion system protein [bacterium]
MLKQVQHDIITRNELIHLSTYPPIHFKKIAFTLAETLITIGIIGVVAALTIPGLINNYKARRLHTQFLKSYSTIQQAFKQMESDDVSLDPSTYNTRSKLFYKTFMNYLNAPFDCSDNTESKQYLPCYPFRQSIPYKTLGGEKNLPAALFDDGQIAMQDGTLIMFENEAGGDIIIVFVDLNGYNNLPNKLGYDLFAFQFNDGVLLTMGDKGTKYTNQSSYCNLNSTSSLSGLACAYKAKNEPDYFKSVVKSFR